MKKFAFFIVIFLFALIVIGCNNKPSGGSAEGTGGLQTEKMEADQLSISDVSILQKESGTSVIYKVNNPNKDYGLSRANITVTLKDAQGRVVFTNSKSIPGTVVGSQYLIVPQESHEYVYDVLGSAPGAAKAEIQIDQKWQQFSLEDIPKVRVVSVNAFPQGGGYVSLPDKLTGEVANDSNVKVNIQVHIVARENGQIVGATSILVEDVEPGKTKAFDESTATGSFVGKQITTYSQATHVPKLNNAPPDLRTGP